MGQHSPQDHMGQHGHQDNPRVTVINPMDLFTMLDQFFGDKPEAPEIPKTLHGRRVVGDDGLVSFDKDDLEIIAEALVFVKNARGALIHDEQVSQECTSKHHRSLVTMARLAEVLRRMEADEELYVTVTPF